MNVNKVLTKEYEEMSTWAIYPKQTQFKPNTNPIKANFKTKLLLDKSLAGGFPPGRDQTSEKRLVDFCDIVIYYAWNRRIILKREIMAKITFNLEEVVNILTSNQLLPPEIIRLKIKAEKIHFVIKTNTFILPFIPASLKYLSFEDNKAIFELSIVGGRLSKAARLINQALKSRIPSYMKLDYPKVVIDIEKILQDNNIRGLHVKSISFEAGRFSIEMCNI